MPGGNRAGPPWGGGRRSRKSSEKYLGRTGFETGGSRVERYAAFVEALIPFIAAISGLVKLFKKPKAPNKLSDTGVEPEDSKILERGDEYAKR
jgi:hypothetical protein